MNEWYWGQWYGCDQDSGIDLCDHDAPVTRQPIFKYLAVRVSIYLCPLFAQVREAKTLRVAAKNRQLTAKESEEMIKVTISF